MINKITKSISSLFKIFFYFIRGSFKFINTEFLIRSYLTASLFVIVAFYATKKIENENLFSDPFTIEWYIICWILYPFGNLLWNDLLLAINGNTVWIINGCILIIWKPIKVTMLFIFAPFFALLGLIYIWFTYLWLWIKSKRQN